MAQKRMFSLSVVDTDRFLEMPVSAQALYFHLGMHGDDDGFVASPRKIARAVGCNLDDLRLLTQKNFIIPFESGVVVIVDWGINNTLKNDRYKPTVYKDEKARLSEGPEGNYLLSDGMPDGTGMETKWNQNGTSFVPQLNITEQNIDKLYIEGAAKSPNAPKKQGKNFIPPTVDEVKAYCQERNNGIDPQRFVDFYTANGWTQGHGKKIKDWRAAVRTWENRDTGRPAGNAKPVPSDADYDFSELIGGNT